VRQLARDLQRRGARWAPIYASNVEYRDPYRKFKGAQGYEKLDFIQTSVQQAAVAITGMRMLDNSAAQISWRLTGRLGVLPINVKGEQLTSTLVVAVRTYWQVAGRLIASQPAVKPGRKRLEKPRQCC
jgi:hypothetical protein